MKVCLKCRAEKGEDDFYLRKADGYRFPTCRRCSIKIRPLATSQANQRKVKYDMTSEQYATLMAEQGGACAICLRPERLVRGGRVIALAVDHDHVTGKTRALLCASCNQSLGKFDDNPIFLRRAAEYLESWA